jgi:hypothetical protein
MQLEQPAADADTPPAIRRFGPLKCRPQAVYAKEQLLAGTRKHPEGAALSEFDVLKRARVRGPILRECTATGFFSFFLLFFSARVRGPILRECTATGAQLSRFTQCAQFTCCTGTNVQILTLRASSGRVSAVLGGDVLYDRFVGGVCGCGGFGCGGCCGLCVCVCSEIFKACNCTNNTKNLRI